MSPLSSLSLFAFASLVAAEVSVEYISYGSSKDVKRDSTLPSASFTLPFIGKTRRSKAKKHLRQSLATLTSGTSYTSPLAGADLDEEYLVNITIGGQHFPVIVDTGSSDLWVVEKGFKCFNLTSSPEDPATCGFGSTGFQTNKSHTFKAYDNHNFNISYGDGEFLTGSVGFETVKIGGLEVDNQEFGLVNNAAWNGDHVNSGLIGLAGPEITSVYKGADPNSDSRSNHEVYDPFFYTAVKEKKVPHPYFSIALNRGTFKSENASPYDANLGQIAFGGYAPVATVSPKVVVPFNGIKLTSGATGYIYYTINVDKYIFPGSSHIVTSNNDTILDSGTTLNLLPSHVVDQYYKAFKTKPTFSDEFGGFVAPCNTPVPEFKVVLGGKTFTIDGRDQLFPFGAPGSSKSKELCLVGTQDGGEGPYILGDVFLRNVVATFDIAQHQVHLAQRKPY